MKARTDLRCRGDQQLREKLLANPDVRRAVDKAKEIQDAGIRKRLLATSVRVTREMSPQLFEIVEGCRTALGVDTEIETYVFPSATFNAAAVKPQHGRLFVLLSSSLLESFDDAELRFVVGHEIGHHLFDHHELPVRLLLEDGDVRDHALELFAWSRYAEISADRAGLACTRSLEPVARSFFKLASGLSGSKVEMRAEDLIGQLGEIQAELERTDGATPVHADDWFATHPFSPLRLRAAKSFMESDAFTEGGSSPDELSAEISALMSLMEPSYLQEQSDAAEAMRRLLFAAGVLVAAASDGIVDEEIAALEKLLGEGRFKSDMNVDALRNDLPRRIRDVNDCVPPLRKIQVLRDLCVIARADGAADDAERAIIQDIAKQTEVDLTIVERTLACSFDLD